MATTSTIPAPIPPTTGGSPSSPKSRPLQKVYDYLKGQNKIRENTLEEFEQNMADPAKLEKVFNYLRSQNKIKSQTLEDFQRVMSPPSQPQPSQPQPPVAGTDFLSQNIEQTAQALAERGVPEVQQAATPEEMQEAIAQAVANLPAMAAQQLGVDQIGQQPSPEAVRFVRQLEQQQRGQVENLVEALHEGEFTGPGMHRPVTEGEAISSAAGAFNKPFVDLVASVPKTAGVVVNEVERLLAGIQGKEKPSIEDNKLYTAGQWLQDKALEVGITATDPRLQDSFFFSDVPAAGGSALAIIMSQGRSGFAKPALTQTVTKAPLRAGAQKAAEKLVKAVTSRGATAGGLMMGAAEYDAAINAGASEEEAFGVFLKNYMTGLTETVPLERALARINRLTGNKIIDVIKAGGVGGIEEATQEAVQTYLTNKIAQGSYDPQRDSMADILRSVGAGAFVGFFLPGIGVAMQRMTPEQREETRAVLNQAFKEINPEKAAQVEQDLAAAQTEAPAEIPTQAEPVEQAAAPEPEPAPEEVPQSDSPVTTETNGEETQTEGRQEGDGVLTPEPEPEPAAQAAAAPEPLSELDASWRQAHQSNDTRSLREWLLTNAQVGDEISFGDGDFTYEVTQADDDMVILRGRDLDPETGQFTEGASILLRRGENDAQEKGFAKAQTRDLKVLLGGTPEYVRPQQFRSEMQAITDPAELARMYVHEVRDLTGVDPRNIAIADALQQLGGVTARSVERFGDVNVVGKNIARAYIRKDGFDIDVIAQHASTSFNPDGDGTDIDPNDVWEFMLTHWDIGSIYTPKGNQRLAQIAERYKELTGKKLNRRIAQLILDKQQADDQVEGIPEVSLQSMYSDEELMDALKIIDNEGITPERLKSDKKLLSLFNDAFPYRKEDLERIRFIFDYANTPEGSKKIDQLVSGQVQQSGQTAAERPGLSGLRAGEAPTGVAEPEPTPVSDAVQEQGTDALPVQEPSGDRPTVEEGTSESEPQEAPVQGTSDQPPASAEDIEAAKPESKSEILSETRSGKRAGVIGAPNSAMQYDAGLFDSRTFGKVQDFLTKYFTSKGYLPQEVFDRWIRTKGEIAKYEAQIRFTLRDIKAAIAKEYVDAKGRSRKLTDGEIIDLNLALQGKQPQGTIPDRTAALIRDMRNQVDNLSRRFIDEGVVAGDLAATFTDNLGVYLTRSYRKHDDPFWAEFVPPEIRNKAEGFIRNNAQYRAQEYFAKAAKLRDRHMKKDDLIKRFQERIKEARQPFQAKISDKTTPQQVRDVIEREMQAVVDLRQKIDRLEKRDYKKIARQNKKKADKLMKEGKEMEAQEFLTRHTKALERDKTKPQRLKRMRDRLKELEKPFEARMRDRMTPDQVREIIDNAFDTIQKLQTEIDKLQERDFLLEADQLEAQGHELMRMTDEEVQGMINFLLYDKNAPMAIMKGSKLGSKDLSILKRRKDIAPEIRALMGEYSDPLLNYARTITKMANLIAKHHFLIDVRAQGMGKFLFEKPTGKYAVQIAAKGSKTMEPLNGLYTTKEIAEAFEEFNSTEVNTTFFQWWVRANGLIKAGKTVGSVMTHVRNFVGNIGFVVMNGHWRLNKFGKAAQVAWANIYSSDEVIKEKFKEYVELGVIGDGGQSGELRQYLDDIRKGKDFFETINESRMKKFGRKIVGTAQSLYQFEDDVYKIFAFENEYARYKKAFPDWTEEQLKQKCATIVRNTYPTYSLTPRIVKMFRLNPLVGSFVSFPAEVLRTTYNTVALAREELANPATRSIGVVRASGIMASLMMSTVASYFSRMALGLGADDDEDLRIFVAPWQKNSEFLYTKREGAKIRLIDMGYTDPHSYIKRPVYDLFQSPEEEVIRSIGDAAWSLMEPFLSEEISTERLIDFTRNKKANNDHVYNPNAPLGDIAQDVFMHFWGGAEIGTMSSLRRIYKAMTDKTSEHGTDYEVRNEVMGLMLGIKEETKDIGQSLVFRAYDIRNAAEIAKRDLQQVKKNKAATPEEIANAQREYEASMKRITEMGLKAYNAAVRLGVDPKEARLTMTKARVPQLTLAIAGQRQQERAQQSDND